MKRAIHKMSALLLVATLAASAEAPYPLMPTSGPYRVYEMPERTDLLTPEGNRKQVYGNFGPDGQGSYRVEIPVAALKPSPTPTVLPAAEPTRTPAPKATVSPAPSPTATVVACAPTPTSGTERRPASLDHRPDEIDPLVVKANRLYNQRRFVEASEYVDEVLRRRPDYVRGWMMRGSLHQMLGHRDLASEAYQKARTLSGDDPEVLRALEGGRR